jgi:hypothetical protein
VEEGGGRGAKGEEGEEAEEEERGRVQLEREPGSNRGG